MKILLIEDQPAVSSTIKQGLEEAGYAVDHAIDGVRGMQQSLQESYSLIILDVLIPRMDGIQVCKGLRSYGKTVPLLLMATEQVMKTRIKDKDVGATDYITRPFEFNEFLEKVQELIK